MLLNKKLEKKNLTQISQVTNLPRFKIAEKQNTISNIIHFNGIGLHSGKIVKMSLKPSDEETGIVFRLKNKLTNISDINATYKNVSDTRLCTTLQNNDNVSVSTTEHLLSALYASNIDNVIVELDSNEIPILDGSSKYFLKALSENGRQEQNSFRKFVKIKKMVEVRSNNSLARVLPNKDTTISCEINFSSKIIGKQSISFPLNPSFYENEICSARTFGFLDDISNLRKQGLTLGGSLDNAIVISKDKVLNKDGLRFNDEFVRHKALDFIGDLALSGNKLIGSFLSINGGHSLNFMLVKKIFSSRHNWGLVDSNQDPIF